VLRDETITAGNATLVAAQNRIALAHAWGGGEIASADGIRFVVFLTTVFTRLQLRGIAAVSPCEPQALFFFGTFSPARRASESPMAMACLRLLTFVPDRPLFSVPRLRSSITFFTFR
jgi:TnpA family transposase